MATMWNATTRAPSILFQHVQYPQVFDQSVAECTIELKDVAIRSHSRVPKQIARILHGKDVFPCCHWALIVTGKLCLQFIIERISSFLVPTQLVRLKSTRVSNCGLKVKTSIRVHR